MAAIDATLDDLVAGRPMDRLICGDVGFGKTEVALRAAFVAAMNGKQVALVVPTTLLARQHYQHLRGALPRPAAEYRPGLAAGRLGGAGAREEGHRRRHHRHRHRHACAARQGDRVQGSRPPHRRRGAAFRREAQGAAEGAPRRRPRADALRHADPAHAAAGADRRARPLDDRHPADRPAGGPHLHRALRRAHHPRGAAARAAARRAILLRRAAHLRSRRDQGVPRRRTCRRRRSAWRTGRCRPASSTR